MSVDRPRTGAALTATHRGHAAATRFDSRSGTLPGLDSRTGTLPGLDSRAAARGSRGSAPASRLGEPEAIDPATTVELSPEMVAALIAESAGAGAAAPGPIATAAAPTLIWRRDRPHPHRAPPPHCHHRGLLAIALLWSVLATGLLIVAFYVLSVVARAGAHGP